MTHVPYRGSAPATLALISGQVDVLFVDLGPMLPQIRARKARVLGITSKRVFPTAPDIKPLAEVGMPILAGHRCLADAARDRRHAEADP